MPTDISPTVSVNKNIAFLQELSGEIVLEQFLAGVFILRDFA